MTSGEEQPRRAPRFEVQLAISFETELSFVKEHATNISRGGLFIRTDQRPLLGTVLPVEVCLPGGARLSGRARVAHLRDGPSGGVGLSFLSPDDAFLASLDGYLASLVLEARPEAEADAAAREASTSGAAAPEAAVPGAAAGAAAPGVSGPRPVVLPDVLELEPEPPRAEPAIAPRMSEAELEAAWGAGVRSQVGPWELSELIARGAVGEVHRARALYGAHGGQLAAVKRVRTERARDAWVRASFAREASLSPLLLHPNIVATLDVGESPDGPWLAMELVDGLDVARWLQRVRAEKGTIALEVAAFVVREVLLALERAHAARDREGRPLRLVHCDVSPGNVLLSKTGEVKLSDFGVAATREGPVLRAELLGKQQYRSPELVRGELSPVVDLWAAGVLLYELLSLHTPFERAGPDEVARDLREGRATPLRTFLPDLEPRVEAVVRRALAPAPEHRFRTATEFLRALTPLVPEASAASRALASALTGPRG